MVRDEVRILNVLSRNNAEESHIVRFYEAFGNRLHHYLVFEMLEKSLFQLQEERNFRPLEMCHIRTITYQMLQALGKLKESGVIHADIKPENIMIVNQRQNPYQVKLIDFGTSFMVKDLGLYKAPYVQTRFYRAPEILLGLPFCEKVDIWSLGCVMAELYLGYPLYPAKTGFELVEYIIASHGQPSAKLLNAGEKTSHFFDRVERAWGKPTWKLKTDQESPSNIESHTQQAVRYYRKRCLAYPWKMLQIPQFGRQGTYEVVTADHKSMVKLIKRMLTLDPDRRISASSALSQPFLTMTHLRASSSCRRYRDLSEHWLRRAVPLQQPNLERQHFTAECCASSTRGTLKKATPDSAQHPTKARRGSFRRAVQSLFTCFYAGQDNKTGVAEPHSFDKNSASIIEVRPPTPFVNKAQRTTEEEDSESHTETSSSIGEDDVERVVETSNSCSSMQPEVSSEHSDISIEEISPDPTRHTPESEEGCQLSFVQSIYTPSWEDKHSTPPCCHSDSMEATQGTSDSVRAFTSSTVPEVLSERSVDSDKAVCDKTGKEVNFHEDLVSLGSSVSILEDDSRWTFKRPDSSSSMRPVASFISSDISCQESSPDSSQPHTKSKGGSLMKSLRSFFSNFWRKKKPAPGSSHSDPMEGPHCKDSGSSNNPGIPAQSHEDTDKAVSGQTGKKVRQKSKIIAVFISL
ncbi:hypothetical protein MATL_G00117690 [Megalops atlanticus]|uniref:Protein kinase domain-containing protein n=1 Tax=Megalops atlanticus TaxID=7932 RepID=A0A9D3TCP8_MEGAT|nr:hypothetical protein MATL_G00117690 [Megalops atlanticus]